MALHNIVRIAVMPMDTGKITLSEELLCVIRVFAVDGIDIYLYFVIASFAPSYCYKLNVRTLFRAS